MTGIARWVGTVRHVWFLPLWLCSDLGKGMEVTEGAANRTAGGAFFSTLCMKGKEHDTPLRFFLFEFYELYFVLFWTHWWNPHVTRYEFSDPEHLHCDPATWRWNSPWNWADQIVRSSIVLGQRWRLIPARYHCKVGVCRWVHPKSTSCACLILFGTSCIFKEQSPAFAIYIPCPFHLLPLLPSWCHWAPGQQPDHGKCHCWIGWKLGSTRLSLAHCWELVDSFRSAMWRRRHRGVCGISKYVLGLMRWITAEAEVSIWIHALQQWTKRSKHESQ